MGEPAPCAHWQRRASSGVGGKLRLRWHGEAMSRAATRSAARDVTEAQARGVYRGRAHSETRGARHPTSGAWSHGSPRAAVTRCGRRRLGEGGTSSPARHGRLGRRVGDWANQTRAAAQAWGRGRAPARKSGGGACWMWHHIPGTAASRSRPASAALSVPPSFNSTIPSSSSRVVSSSHAPQHPGLRRNENTAAARALVISSPRYLVRDSLWGRTSRLLSFRVPRVVVVRREKVGGRGCPNYGDGRRSSEMVVMGEEVPSATCARRRSIAPPRREVAVR
ncbi:hypothetical protein DFH08DRAFT_886580 [Mycena albidolilacea]|uniref:Uncharacterized protein n=1 Tax=Mycena albidolilacea TaxID=1033008 RepID=A0AAD6ZJV7_9AGAR|nr:hypothetical protein DFH08DRAFT_886580 [Mycena albidolilacea]